MANTGGVSNAAQTFEGPKGFLAPLGLPVLTQTQRDALGVHEGGVQGALIYNSTTNTINVCVFPGTWSGVQGAS